MCSWGVGACKTVCSSDFEFLYTIKHALLALLKIKELKN